MARKAKEEAASEEPKDESKKSSKRDFINKILKADAVKKSKFEIFADSTLTQITSYIPSGSYSLNRLISGSYFKGFPHGRITGLGGKKGVGKSYICGNAIREAQKLDYLCVVFESESSLDRNFLLRLGVNIDELIFKSVTTINEWKSSVINMLETIHAADPDQKVLIILDSAGNLATEKEMEDARENNPAMDRGLRSKQFKMASRVLTNAVAYNNAAMILTNHIYEKQAQNPNVPPEEVFGGGEGLQYVCSTIIMLRKLIKKEEKKNVATGLNEKVPSTFIIKANTIKNRLVPEGSKAEILVSFKNGLHKWFGLLEDALTHGYMVKDGTIYVKHLDKKFALEKLYHPNNENCWSEIIHEMDEKVQKANAFNSVLSVEEVLEEADLEVSEVSEGDTKPDDDDNEEVVLED